MIEKQIITAEHLIALLGVMATIAGILFWRMFTRMEKKIDDWFQQHLECRERQEATYMKKRDFDQDWRPGRVELQKRINKHSHDSQTGKVIITEE